MKTTTTSLSEIKSRGQNESDIFICSASFEDRSYSIPNALGPTKSGVNVIAFNEDNFELVKDSVITLQATLGEKAKLCNLRTDDPIHTVDSIARIVSEAWEKKKESRHIYVDITTFTREAMLVLIAYLWAKLESGDELTLYYNRAREYDVGTTAADKWLSKGIREVRSVIGFPGRLVPSRKTHMIVMAGFEQDRALRLIADTEPSLVSIGIPDGTEEHTAAHQFTNERRFRQLVNRVGSVEEFVFSAYDPSLCAEAILDQIGAHPEMNVILAPMNTKISTVGAAMAGLKQPELQICYAQADLYNYRNYSLPGETVYEMLHIVEG